MPWKFKAGDKVKIVRLPDGCSCGLPGGTKCIILSHDRQNPGSYILHMPENPGLGWSYQPSHIEAYGANRFPEIRHPIENCYNVVEKYLESSFASLNDIVHQCLIEGKEDLSDSLKETLRAIQQT